MRSHFCKEVVIAEEFSSAFAIDSFYVLKDIEQDQGAPLKMSEDWTTNVEVFLNVLLVSFHESRGF